jgi:hypothetical protein
MPPHLGQPSPPSKPGTAGPARAGSLEFPATGGWRATLSPAGPGHSVTSAVGRPRSAGPRRAVQRAACEAVVGQTARRVSSPPSVITPF